MRIRKVECIFPIFEYILPLCSSQTLKIPMIHQEAYAEIIRKYLVEGWKEI